MIAAANASMISSVSVSIDSVESSSARKMPASAAIDVPSAHENCEVSPGRAPLSAASSRLSTTARIATPRRVRYRSSRIPSASSSPATIVISRYQGRNVCPMLNPSLPKNVPTDRVSPGSQNVAARPIRKSIRPIVTTSCDTNGAVVRRRMKTRSITAPINGAATSTVSRSATIVWMPALIFSSQ